MIVFFFHIPKTAGSSISVAARSTLSRGRTMVIEDTHTERLIARLRRLADRQDTYFVQGHISPLKEFFSIPMKRITVLRQAEDRLISHFCYCFERRYYDLEQLEFFRSRKNYNNDHFDYDDLVTWITKFRMDDFQVRFLSGEYGGSLSKTSVESAIRTLSSLDFVATTDNLDEFFDVLSGLTRRNFNFENLPHTNRSNRNRLRISRDELGVIKREYCQKDDELICAFNAQKDEKYRLLQENFLEKIDKTSLIESTRILKLLAPNKTLYEIFFKIKRRSMGIAVQGIEVVGNFVTRG